MTDIQDLDFGSLGDYQPTKITDDPMPIRFKKQPWNVESARIEEYLGDFEDYKGHTFFKYALIACDGIEVDVYQGTKGAYVKKPAGKRMLRCSFDLNNEVKLKKLGDLMFTALNKTFKDPNELQTLIEEFAAATLTVSAYHFTGDDGSEIQMHKVLGVEEKKNDATSEVPF